ncbi:hypothetical protein MTR_3g451030 [Medicago truncatula]|uniref:Uncharacterized protein n=1 Tax=Medicago truncatula TaxID=3880 RepID=A0A072UX94_MEDTR|nr:hypothetical protein MTR_3g451030 [Medicago truncatula]
MKKLYDSSLNLVSNQMTVNFKMFSPLMKHWICSNVQSNHCNSQVDAPSALYSSSYEDLETVNCFLVLQEMRELQ